MWYIHAVEYHSTIKLNKPSIHATTWMNLENIVPGDSLSQRPRTMWLFVHEMSRISKSIERESRLMVAQGGGGAVRE